MSQHNAERQLLLHNRILEELSAKHREFETLTSLLEEVVFCCDNEGRLTLLNSAWLHKTGWTVAESLNNPLQSYIGNASVLADFSRQLSQDDVLALEVSIASRDGQQRIFNLKARHNGSSWYGSLHDITELRDAVEALEDSRAEEKKLSLVASGTDNVVIITDAKGTIEWVNRAFSSVTGLSPEQALGRSPGQLLQGEGTDTATIDKMRAGIAAGTGFSAEVVNYHINGEMYWVDIDCTPIFDSNNKLSNFIAIERVITEKKLAEKSLRDSEQHYRGILDTVTEAIFYCDKTLTLQYTNPAWTRITGHQLLGNKKHSLEQFVHPEDLAHLHSLRDQAYLSNAGVKQTLRMKSAGGSWRRVDMHLSSKRPSNNLNNLRSRELTGTLVDVEDQWQRTQAILLAKREAEELSRARTRFIANMSHEIRTPLNAIIGMTSVLQQSPLNDDQALCVDTLCHGGKALLSLVDDVLDLSKLDSAEVCLEDADFDIGAICEEAVDIVSASVQEKNLSLSLYYQSPIPAMVKGDAHRLRQVLLNLLTNAIKFTSEGEIQLSLDWTPSSAEQGKLAVRVSDTGIGIPEQRIENLFDAFTQADPSTTREFGGTGLGLAICRQICRAMGGDIRAENRAGGGAEFSFSIPLAVEIAPPTPCDSQMIGSGLDPRSQGVAQSLCHLLGLRFSSDTPTTPSPQLKLAGEPPLNIGAPPPVLTPQRLRNTIEAHSPGVKQIANKPTQQPSLNPALCILIAEDALPNQLVIKAMLKQLGYQQVDVVENGLQAVELCRKNHYDLALLDLHMPVMDGISAAKEIRSRTDKKAPMIVAASADVTLDARNATKLAGFDDWLAKPFTRDALVKILQLADRPR